MRYTMFVDESGDHGLVNINQDFPVFVLCGVLICNNTLPILESAVKDLKAQFWGDKKVIFHSRDIRKCDKEFQILFDMELKQRFFRGLNEIISNMDYLVIASAINKEKHIKKYGKLADNVYEIGLSFIIERSIFALDDRAGNNSELKVIIEKRGKKEDNQLRDYFNKLLQRGTYYVSRTRLKKHNIELEFRDKKEDYTGLQIADLLAYPLARYIMDKERANPTFEVFKDKIYSKDGKMYGLKEFP